MYSPSAVRFDVVVILSSNLTNNFDERRYIIVTMNYLIKNTHPFIIAVQEFIEARHADTK